jgi:hypothetical protein
MVEKLFCVALNQSTCSEVAPKGMIEEVIQDGPLRFGAGNCVDHRGPMVALAYPRILALMAHSVMLLPQPTETLVIVSKAFGEYELIPVSHRHRGPWSPSHDTKLGSFRIHWVVFSSFRRARERYSR